MESPELKNVAPADWSEQRLIKIRALIRQLYRVVSDLETEFQGRKFTPDGHLVGSIGEVVASYSVLKRLNAETNHKLPQVREYPILN